MNYFFSIILLISISACLNNKDVENPKEVIGELVKLQFSNSITRENLTDYFTPGLTAEFKALNDEQFAIAFNMKLRKLKSMKVEPYQCDVETCSLTYIISYQDVDQEGRETREINVKKVAQFKKSEETQNRWKIYDLTDIKTHIEFKE